MKKYWMPDKWRVPLEKCSCGKVSYDKKAAISAKNSRWKQDHTELRVYQCNGTVWHLTSVV